MWSEHHALRGIRGILLALPDRELHHLPRLREYSVDLVPLRIADRVTRVVPVVFVLDCHQATEAVEREVERVGDRRCRRGDVDPLRKVVAQAR